jgi:hypothetical protein
MRKPPAAPFEEIVATCSRAQRAKREEGECVLEPCLWFSLRCIWPQQFEPLRLLVVPLLNGLGLNLLTKATRTPTKDESEEIQEQSISLDCPQ